MNLRRAFVIFTALCLLLCKRSALHFFFLGYPKGYLIFFCVHVNKNGKCMKFQKTQ